MTVARLSGNQKGFTLLEVIIAITIMVLAFAAILSVESNSIGATIRAKEMNIVSMLARGKMVEMEYKVEGKTFDETQKEQEGTFEAPYDKFRWKAEVKEIKFPTMTMGGGGNGKDDDPGTQYADMLTKLVTKYLSKAIRELVITVLWKHDSTEMTYSVSTYWVDLNHEFETSE